MRFGRRCSDIASTHSVDNSSIEDRLLSHTSQYTSGTYLMLIEYIYRILSPAVDYYTDVFMPVCLD